MNPDLVMSDELLKKTGSGNLFMVFGEPDIDIKPTDDGRLTVEIRGLDVYDPTTGQLRSSSVDDIAAWFLDTDYNGDAFFVRHAYFTGADDPYDRLRRALRADISDEAWATVNSNVSRPFPRPKSGKIAVKVINHYGDEVMKVLKVEKGSGQGRTNRWADRRPGPGRRRPGRDPQTRRAERCRTRGVLPSIESEHAPDARGRPALRMNRPAVDAFDPLAIIRVLNEHQVRFVVIGGIAAGVQGAIWATADLHIAYARDRENHERLAAALAELEAEPVELPAGVHVALDVRSLAAGTNWTLMTRFGRLDLLGEPGGGLDYAKLAPRARLIQGEQTYKVASIEDLISMKTAAGRARDIGQVELLRLTAEELARRSEAGE
jgi:hypothetical protein